MPQNLRAVRRKIRTVQSLAAEAHFFVRVRRRFVDVAVLQARAAAVNGGVGGLALTTRAAGALAYGWYGWTQVLDGTLTPGTFTLRIKDDEFLVHSLMEASHAGIVDGSLPGQVARLYGYKPADVVSEVEIFRRARHV